MSLISMSLIRRSFQKKGTKAINFLPRAFLVTNGNCKMNRRCRCPSGCSCHVAQAALPTKRAMHVLKRCRCGPGCRCTCLCRNVTRRFISDTSDVLKDSLLGSTEKPPQWMLTPNDAEQIWKTADKEMTGIISDTQLRPLLFELLKRQVVLLQQFIKKRQDVEAELEQEADEGLMHFIPKWKQWGLSIEEGLLKDEVSLATHLLEQLEDAGKTEEMVAHLEVTVNPNSEERITFMDFYTSLKGDKVLEVQEEILEKQEAKKTAKSEAKA